MAIKGYMYKKLEAPDHVALQDLPRTYPVEDINTEDSSKQSIRERNPTAFLAIFTMFATLILLLTAVSVARAGLLDFGKRQATTASSTYSEVPQYFQTTPEIFAGKMVLPRLQQARELIDIGQDLLRLAEHLSWLK